MSNGLLINEYNVFGIRNPPAASHLTNYAPQAWQTTDSAAVNWATFSALKTKVDTFLDPQNGETIATALDSLGEIQTFLANDGGGFGTAIVNSLGYDPVWFCVLVLIMIQTSYLTPPMAPAIFYLRGVAPKSIKTTQNLQG